MRFIHTADIHLDSPLHALSARAGDERARDLAGATRRAFSFMVETAVERRVDFVVIAGDLYDGDWPDFSTGLFFAEQMNRLDRAGIRVAVVKGNHDAESKITRTIVGLMPNVMIFDSRRPHTVVWEELGVALHGQSFSRRDISDNLAVSYPAPVPGMLNIGVLHTAAEGRPGHDAYAPCTVAELAARGYDYWALGHVHSREVLCERPWIVFPGNIQGRHANETGPKGFTLVTAEAGDIRVVEHVVADVVRWARVTVDVTGCDGLEAVSERVRAALSTAAAEAGRRTLAVRLRLSGATPAHRRLAGDREQLAVECTHAAIWTGADVWIEKVELATRPPTTASQATAASADALGALLAAVRDIRQDPAEMAEIRAALSALVNKLPQKALENTELKALTDETLAEILADAEAMVMTRLLGDEEGGAS